MVGEPRPGAFQKEGRRYASGSHQTHGASDVIASAARALPARLREPAFAVAADLVLADGKLEGPERRFLVRLGTNLRLNEETTRKILKVIVIKNGA